MADLYEAFGLEHGLASHQVEIEAGTGRLAHRFDRAAQRIEVFETIRRQVCPQASGKVMQTHRQPGQTLECNDGVRRDSRKVRRHIS